MGIEPDKDFRKPWTGVVKYFDYQTQRSQDPAETPYIGTEVGEGLKNAAKKALKDVTPNIDDELWIMNDPGKSEEEIFDKEFLFGGFDHDHVKFKYNGKPYWAWYQGL